MSDVPIEHHENGQPSGMEQFEPERPTYEGLSFGEVGYTGLNRWGGDVAEELLPQLRYPRAAKVFQEMADNDPTVGAILYMSEQLIKKAGWSVEAGGDSPGDIAAAKFLEECMSDMGMSWDDTISEILSMMTYGFSFHEVIYKVRQGPNAKIPQNKSDYADGRIGWAGFPIRSQHTLAGWEFDEYGYVTAFKQWGPPDFKSVEIPMHKGLLFRTKVARDNPEGRSLLRNAYRPWYFKKRIEEIEGIGIERDLAGLPVIIPPEDIDIWDVQNPNANKMRKMAETLVRSIRRDKSEGVVLPSKWELKLLSTGGSRQFDTNAIVNRYDHKIAITILADIVMMGGDKVGSFALGEVKKSLLAASLEAQIQKIADVFNKFAVTKLFEYNYFPGMTNRPKILAGQVETPDIKELAFLLRSAGMNVRTDLPLMNLIRGLISLDPIDDKQLDEWYGTVEEVSDNPNIQANNEANTFSSEVDPVGHAMDDGSQLYEGR